MKRLLVFITACLFLFGLSSCGPKCKKCHIEVMPGVKSATQEYCGDQLEQVMKAPGMICE